MPGITNPAEEYFKDGLWAWVTDAWKKLVATAGGALHVQVAGQEADVEVKQTAPADLTPGVCGWIGAAWQKLPILWGYSERYVHNGTHTMTEDANYEMNFPVVGADEVFVLQGVSWTNRAQVVRGIVSIETDGAYLVYLQDKSSPGAWQYAVWAGEIVLAWNDFVRITFVSNLDTQVVDGFIWGYKMKIAE